MAPKREARRAEAPSPVQAASRAARSPPWLGRYWPWKLFLGFLVAFVLEEVFHYEPLLVYDGTPFWALRGFAYERPYTWRPANITEEGPVVPDAANYSKNWNGAFPLHVAIEDPTIPVCVNIAMMSLRLKPDNTDEYNIHEPSSRLMATTMLASMLLTLVQTPMRVDPGAPDGKSKRPYSHALMCPQLMGAVQLLVDQTVRFEGDTMLQHATIVGLHRLSLHARGAWVLSSAVPDALTFLVKEAGRSNYKNDDALPAAAVGNIARHGYGKEVAESADFWRLWAVLLDMNTEERQAAAAWALCQVAADSEAQLRLIEAAELVWTNELVHYKQEDNVHPIVRLLVEHHLGGGMDDSEPLQTAGLCITDSLARRIPVFAPELFRYGEGLAASLLISMGQEGGSGIDGCGGGCLAGGDERPLRLRRAAWRALHNLMVAEPRFVAEFWEHGGLREVIRFVLHDFKSGSQEQEGVAVGLQLLASVLRPDDVAGDDEVLAEVAAHEVSHVALAMAMHPVEKALKMMEEEDDSQADGLKGVWLLGHPERGRANASLQALLLLRHLVQTPLWRDFFSELLVVLKSLVQLSYPVLQDVAFDVFLTLLETQEAARNVLAQANNISFAISYAIATPTPLPDDIGDYPFAQLSTRRRAFANGRCAVGFAARALRKLATTTQTRRALADAGGIRVLVAALESDACGEGEWQAAALALRGLALDGGLAAEQQDPGRAGVAALVRRLAHGAPTSAEAAVRALMSLVGKHAAVRQAIVEEGGIPALVELARAGSGSAREAAVWVLRSLAAHADNRPALVAAGGIGALVEAVRSGTRDAREVGALTLRHLADGSAPHSTAIQEAGGVEALLALLQRGSPRGREAAALTLWAMAAASGSGQVMRQAGMMEAVRELQAGGPPKAREAAAELLTLAISETYGSTGAVKASLQEIRELAALARNATIPLGAAAAGALARVAEHAAGRERMWAAGVIPPLMEVLASEMHKPEAASCTERLATAMRLLVEHPRCRAEVVQADGIQTLIHLLEEGSIPARTSAALALAGLAGEGEEAKGAIQEAGGVEALLSLRGAQHLESKEMQEAVGRALVALAYRGESGGLGSSRSGCASCGGTCFESGVLNGVSATEPLDAAGRARQRSLWREIEALGGVGSQCSDIDVEFLSAQGYTDAQILQLQTLGYTEAPANAR